MESGDTAVDCSAFDLPGGSTGFLLIHGFSGTPFEMRYLGERLNAEGHTVAAILLPGHATRGPEMYRAGRRDWYIAAAQGLDDLRRRCREVFVIGLSMGSLLALELAAERADDVQAIGVLAPALVLGDPRLRRYARFVRPFLPFLPSSWQTVAKRSSDILDDEARERHPQFPMPLRGLLELVRLQDEVRALLPRVRCPALILHGRHDQTCPLENTEIVRGGISSSRVRVSILEESAHIVTVDRERDLVAGEIAAFLPGESRGTSRAAG